MSHLTLKSPRRLILILRFFVNKNSDFLLLFLLGFYDVLIRILQQLQQPIVQATFSVRYSGAFHPLDASVGL